MSELNYIVTNSGGLNVRSQMNTMNPTNLLRRMGANEGFVVYEIYNVRGISGLQTWGRVSNNPGGISQEYVCLQIGNKVYATLQQPSSPAPVDTNWQTYIDAWARSQGYNGPRP